MINKSEQYKLAITGDSRRMYLNAVIDLISPNIVFGNVSTSGQSAYSKPTQLYDKNYESEKRYATLELNRFFLDGNVDVFPENPSDVTEEIGFLGNTLLYTADTVNNPVSWVELQFENVNILQAFSVYFSTDTQADGVPEEFTVEVKQGGTAYYTKTVTGNTETEMSFSGFTVYEPDSIRITVHKMSLPSRFMRVVEILPGLYEEWDSDTIFDLSIKHQVDFACTSLPYGTCSLSMDNQSRRFEPRNKSGIFNSIEEGQPIPINLGVLLEDGTVDYTQVGIYYQYSAGWKTGDNGLTMKWDLVDIIGLLAERSYIVPASLPTTLEGWISDLVAQLGLAFVGHYIIDPNYASMAVTANKKEDVEGQTCGDILRYLCMSVGCFPRADAETGYLAVEPLWNQGNYITLDNMVNYPLMKANQDLALITFTLADGNNTVYNISGNNIAASNTVSVENPFIHTVEQAVTASKNIIAMYGGNSIEINGRGDMSAECGDVASIQLNESIATSGRLIQQEFFFSDGVMRDLPSSFIQADGSFLFEDRELITTSGTWKAPSGVNQIRVIVGGGGSGGTDGKNGTWNGNGANGVNGSGGQIWYGTININEGQEFNISIGAGGEKGQAGGITTFGDYSSANGHVYLPSYTDIKSGDTFGRTGVTAPLNGSSDGGKGGRGGKMGKKHIETITTVAGSVEVEIIDRQPKSGESGVKGASGFVLVYYNKS